MAGFLNLGEWLVIAALLALFPMCIILLFGNSSRGETEQYQRWEIESLERQIRRLRRDNEIMASYKYKYNRNPGELYALIQAEKDVDPGATHKIISKRVGCSPYQVYRALRKARRAVDANSAPTANDSKMRE